MGAAAPKPPEVFESKRKQSFVAGKVLHAGWCSRVALAVVALCTFSTSVLAQDRQEVDRVRSGDLEVILYDDGFWRYTDAETPVCHEIPEVGLFCATPNVWAEFPARQTDLHKRRPQFVSGDDFWAQANALVPISSEKLAEEDVEAFIRNRVYLRNGLRPNIVVSDRFDANGSSWQRIVFEAEGKVKAFSLTAMNQGFVIVETHERKTTLFGSEHKKLHLSFIESLELARDG